jgi:hypothetical protein
MKELSSTAKFILNSFQNKYIYYAIDDILYLLKSDPIERDSLQQYYIHQFFHCRITSPLTFFDLDPWGLYWWNSKG